MTLLRSRHGLKDTQFFKIDAHADCARIERPDKFPRSRVEAAALGKTSKLANESVIRVSICRVRNDSARDFQIRLTDR